MKNMVKFLLFLGLAIAQVSLYSAEGESEGASTVVEETAPELVASTESSTATESETEKETKVPTKRESLINRLIEDKYIRDEEVDEATRMADNLPESTIDRVDSILAMTKEKSSPSLLASLFGTSSEDVTSTKELIRSVYRKSPEVLAKALEKLETLITENEKLPTIDQVKQVFNDILSQ